MSTPIFDHLAAEHPDVRLPAPELAARHAADLEDAGPIQPPPEQHGRDGDRDE